VTAFGFISVETHPERVGTARIRVNGEDVTRRCYAASDIDGYADCFKLNEDGQIHLAQDKSEAAKERLIGVVEIDFPNGLD
jgi:hypothetical protein